MVLTRHTKTSSELSGRARSYRDTMPSDRRFLAAAFAAITFLTARPGSGRGGPPGPDLARRRRGSPVPPGHVAWTAVSGRGQVRVPDQRRRRHELAGARRGQGRLLHAQHARDAQQDDPERDVLLARRARSNAAGEISAWTQPRSFRKLWNLQPALQSPSSGAALSFPTNPVVLPVGGRAGRRALPRLRSRATRRSGSLVLALRQPGRPEGPAERRRHLRRDHARRWRPGSYYWSVMPVDAEGQPRRRDPGRLVQLAVAFRRPRLISRT